ncbi:MAG: DNA-directed RNA polymerase subunit alpha [Candidatus Staskawiczbacteria bacterium RIFCSPLOWO2_01_FULL_38_12b]|uniref:DNA-directed RNA polymerase subunit alpha n=1 Tax=Candidatus Staskawiczbacteria bacterium RIFCSPLOWO2_01_FULL_38_12b TaxID=1802214 RepID=A0A1G2IGB2_9BACT|nr:MAG: DNA-directed RNA polymerase subunit alpha [Candidatus Staskawiczbacteria bacterium RIFCSPLOWO2_01_FULL_38_12b]
MISLPLPPKVIKKNKHQSVFEIDGLYPGYGVTIGNSLRRVLLSSLEGVAVTEVKIKGVSHEFSTMEGVLEDAIMILLNLKNLRFKIHEGQTQKVRLLVKGEKKVTGADFKLFPQIVLANPELHIATITDKKTELDIEITIEKGIGYEPKDQRKIKKVASPLQANSEIGVIVLDAIFTPIKNVNFQVENMRVGDRTDFNKLSLEIETDGTITPQEAFYQATEILIKHFVLIFEGKSSEDLKIQTTKEGEIASEKPKTKKQTKTKDTKTKKAKK